MGAVGHWCFAVEKGFFWPPAGHSSDLHEGAHRSQGCRAGFSQTQNPQTQPWFLIWLIFTRAKGIVLCQLWISPCFKMHLWDTSLEPIPLSSSLNSGFYSWHLPPNPPEAKPAPSRSCSRGCSYGGEIINDPRCNYLCLKPCSGSADIFPEEGGGVPGRHLAV